jgi:hypothetical protein
VGVVGIPKLGAPRVIQLNGATVWDGVKFVPSAWATSADEDASYVNVRGILPGRAELAWSRRNAARRSYRTTLTGFGRQRARRRARERHTCGRVRIFARKHLDDT